jgi:PrcB C-terminal
MKNMLSMRRLLGVLGVCAACMAALLMGEAAQMKFKSINRGQNSSIEEFREVVVRSAKEWTTLWKQVGTDRPLPKVDFATSMVVGVFLGTRPTGGYTVEITGVQVEGQDLVVSYQERKPGRDELAAQVITSPYDLAIVDRHEGQVRFRSAGKGDKR